MIYVIIYCENVHYDDLMKKATNSPTKLNIISAYGDNQAYHPKVLYFEKGWNNYKYWMSFTPYPNAKWAYENPHIKVSNDMVTWENPIEGINPLDEVPSSKTRTSYNSDSHLVYNSDKNELECWWRYVDGNEIIVYRRVSKDGKKWSKREAIFKGSLTDGDWISPAIIYEDGFYKIWYVFKNEIYYTESSNLKRFTEPRKINIKYEGEKVLSWHLDVIHSDVGYEMIMVAYTSWKKRFFMNLYYTNSKDNVNYSTAKVIMKPSSITKNWDNSGLYRSSILRINGTYYIYYSGQSVDNSKGIGLMYGKNIFDLKSYI